MSIETINRTNFLVAPYSTALQHFEQAKQETQWKGRAVHIGKGILYSIPIINYIVLLVARYFDYKKMMVPNHLKTIGLQVDKLELKTYPGTVPESRMPNPQTHTSHEDLTARRQKAENDMNEFKTIFEKMTDSIMLGKTSKGENVLLFRINEGEDSSSDSTPFDHQILALYFNGSQFEYTSLRRADSGSSQSIGWSKHSEGSLKQLFFLNNQYKKKLVLDSMIRKQLLNLKFGPDIGNVISQYV